MTEKSNSSNMVTKAKCWLLIAMITINILNGVAAELYESNADVERLCYPEMHKNSRKSCECNNVSSSPWGLRAVNIDCSFKNLLTADFSEMLPISAERMDMTWNALERIPMLSSDSLLFLNLMHNNISSVLSKNFINLSNLQELYLSWNSIQLIEQEAFADLAHLQILDISHNNLHSLAFQIFAPLIVLESLYLSWNRPLNQTEGIQELDFYQTFGVNMNLKTLKMEACNLGNISLPQKAVLKELDLRRNRLTQVPENLPLTLEKIDLSENLFDILTVRDTQRLQQVHELYMEDMPRLHTVAADSLIPLVSLQKLSFQNSRRLSTLHEYAFGENATRSATLQTLIFRGTGLFTFNRTLSPVFYQLSTLDLNGVPLHCDCNLVWMKELRLDTNGRCFKPSRLRGVALATADPSDFSCERWPRWIYGIIILALIALCSVGIYLIVMGLRPHGGVTMRRKVGAGSPYARVTIEPNRQENY